MSENRETPFGIPLPTKAAVKAALTYCADSVHVGEAMKLAADVGLAVEFVVAFGDYRALGRGIREAVRLARRDLEV